MNFFVQCVKKFNKEFATNIKRGLNQEGKTERTYLEIDFIANLGIKRYYIQSAFSMPMEENAGEGIVSKCE